MSNFDLNNLLESVNPTFEIPLLCSNLIFPELPSTLKVKSLNINSEIKFAKSLSLIIDQLQFSLYEELMEDFIDVNSIDVDKLTYPDIEWAFFNTRLFSYGTTMDVLVECPDCKAKFDKFQDMISKYSNDEIKDEIPNNVKQQLIDNLKIKEVDILRYLSKDKTLYTDEVQIDLSDYTIDMPDNAPFETYENNYAILTMIPQTFGAYKKIKKFFVDDRHIQTVFKKHANSEIDDINKSIYQTLLILSTFIYKIEIKTNTAVLTYDEILNNIEDIPFLLSKIFSKNDIVKIQSYIQKLFYTININQKHKCPRCGKEITMNYWDYPFRFLEFNIDTSI